MSRTLTMKVVETEEIPVKPRVRMETIEQPYKPNSSKQPTTVRLSPAKVREMRLANFRKRITKRFRKKR